MKIWMWILDVDLAEDLDVDLDVELDV